MKCKCGYIGWADVDNFGMYPKTRIPAHFRCPKCSRTDNIEYIEPADSIREALLFPRKCKGRYTHHHAHARYIVIFLTGGADSSFVGYVIHCPVCGWGHGSGVATEDYHKIKEWAKENKIDDDLLPEIKVKK